ncbi:MAG: hypothetical protein JWM47_251 [Acidimicrobiales bacterium]|nr:hypothetical protein [Acidimicrobiales bacterium]
MGFYVRKSLKAGPFRVNLSKSGVGVSAGVPGFRVGTGPRGNYVHMGRHGVYYRSTLGGGGRAPARPQLMGAPPPAPAPIDVSTIVMEDLTGASVLQFVPSGPVELLEQIREAAARRPIWPWVALGLAVMCLVAPVLFPLGVIGLVGVWWLRQRDIARRSVVIFYDVNDQAADRFERFIERFGQAAATAITWHMTAQGRVNTTYQSKVNAGAGVLVQRKPIRFGRDGPKLLVTNIAVPSIDTGSRSLYLLPDLVLVRDGKNYSTIAWADLRVVSSIERFIEDGAVPRDAVRVGSTWQYVNKNGTPDRRFNNNRQLPILAYGEVQLFSSGGFHMRLQMSSQAGAVALAAGARSMSSAV